ncbi:MAG: SapC family protein [Proteobacteria bacterium]|nr:SapC family protein [Pseudomonadota bacterium]
MAKQLLIYNQVEPINSNKHRNLSVKVGDDYEFARSINSVPIIAAEFPNAAAEYPIVFTDTVDNVIPVVILGLREKENLYIDDQGKWTAKYVPAFIRRYPFVFSISDNDESFTLCIDEEFSGCNEEGRGERLFDDDGQQMQYLENVLEFLKGYQAHFQRTEIFCKKLKELDLLEPMSAQFTTPKGEKVNLTGFKVIDRNKLKKLSGDQFMELAKTDELELTYVHIQSMRNFNLMIEQAMGTDTYMGNIRQDNNGTGNSKKTNKKSTARKTSNSKKTKKKSTARKTSSSKKTNKKSTARKTSSSKKTKKKSTARKTSY